MTTGEAAARRLSRADMGQVIVIPREQRSYRAVVNPTTLRDAVVEMEVDAHVDPPFREVEEEIHRMSVVLSIECMECLDDVERERIAQLFYQSRGEIENPEVKKVVTMVYAAVQNSLREEIRVVRSELAETRRLVSSIGAGMPTLMKIKDLIESDHPVWGDKKEDED